VLIYRDSHNVEHKIMTQRFNLSTTGYNIGGIGFRSGSKTSGKAEEQGASR
jgi:hypothetical protein